MVRSGSYVFQLPNVIEPLGEDACAKDYFSETFFDVCSSIARFDDYKL